MNPPVIMYLIMYVNFEIWFSLLKTAISTSMATSLGQKCHWTPNFCLSTLRHFTWSWSFSFRFPQRNTRSLHGFALNPGGSSPQDRQFRPGGGDFGQCRTGGKTGDGPKKNWVICWERYGLLEPDFWPLPSGNLTQLWKITMFNGQNPLWMVIFHSYVELPEGIFCRPVFWDFNSNYLRPFVIAPIWVHMAPSVQLHRVAPSNAGWITARVVGEAM